MFFLDRAGFACQLTCRPACADGRQPQKRPRERGFQLLPCSRGGRSFITATGREAPMRPSPTYFFLVVFLEVVAFFVVVFLEVVVVVAVAAFLGM